MAVHKLSILVEAIGAGKAAKDLKGVDGAIAGIGARAGMGLRKTGENLGKLGLGLGAAAAAGLVGAVKAASDFEAQLNTINTVAGLTSGELQQVGNGIRGVARDTGASLEDLTGAYYDLVSAGIKPGADALAVLTQANTLAIGGLATTGETVDLLTSAINTYSLDTKGAAKATDMFAEAIALGKVTAAEIATSFATVGSVAQSAGIGLDEIAASYATLTAKGIPAAESMTQMRSAIVSLQAPGADLAAASKKLKVDFAKLAAEKGLPTALGVIRRYSEKTGIPLQKLLGRIEAVNYTLATTGDNADDYAAALRQVGRATGVAAGQMSERQKGLNYELKRLKALALDAGISIGSKLIPKLIPIADKVVKMLESHQDDISSFGDALAGAFDKALEFASKIPWGAVGAGLKVAAEFSGRLMDAFAAMPASVQTTLIALAGLNKLSGGAITGIVGELGKGLIKGVLGMTAGVVNINAGVVNGGGGGLPGAAAGAAGVGLGTAATLIGASVAATVVGSINTRENVDRTIQSGSLAQLKVIADEARKHGVSDTNNAALQELLRRTAPVKETLRDYRESGSRAATPGRGRLGRGGGGGDDRSYDAIERLRTSSTRQGDRSTDAIERLRTSSTSSQDRATDAIERQRNATTQTTAATQQTRSQVALSGNQQVVAAAVSASRIVAAIVSSAPKVTVTNNVSVTSNSVQKSSTTQESRGRGNGSAGGGNNSSLSPWLLGSHG